MAANDFNENFHFHIINQVQSFERFEQMLSVRLGMVLFPGAYYSPGSDLKLQQ